MKFEQHLAVSAFAGLVYGSIGSIGGVSPLNCLVSTMLFCGAGLLPDIDGDTKPFREAVSLASALASIVFLNYLGGKIPLEEVLLIATCIYMAGRFVISNLIRRLTVHRGMFHTVLVALVLSEVVYLVAAGTHELKLFKAGGFLLGYLSHLFVDEWASIEWTKGNLKKSLGTAFKLFGNDLTLNIANMVFAIVLAVWIAVS